MDLNFRGRPTADTAEREAGRFGDGRAKITEAWFEDDGGNRATVLPAGRPCAFVMRARFMEDVEDPIFGMTLQTSEDETVLGTSTLSDDPQLGRFHAGEEVTFRVAFDNVFRPDRYHASPAIAHAGTGLSWIDRRERFAELVVTGTTQTGALVDLPCKLTLDRSGARPAESEVAQ
jgi:hypothetical protein